MRANRTRNETPLNDGLLEYGQVKTKRDIATAKKLGEGFVEIGSLFFSYQSINARFDTYQVSSLSAVDVKVKCFYVKDFEKSHKVKINHSLYDVEGLDIDHNQEYMYLFLRKVGYWDGGNFIQTT
ncbi:phage head-tail adapter protein [Streptococcus cameli]